MLDTSSKRKIIGCKHWGDEINQLYHPTGIFGQDSQNIVYNFGDINISKFIQILLKEWFYLVKPRGYLIIDYTPNKKCDWKLLEKYMWWLWKDKYEIVYHGAVETEEIVHINKKKLLDYIVKREGYYLTNKDKVSLLLLPEETTKSPETKNSCLRFICKKTEATKMIGDEISKWSFGIITNGKRLDYIKEIIKSIRDLKIPEYEILICGKYFNTQEKNVKYLPFNKRDDLGWITKKKNIIVKKSNFENICVIHDRLIFDKKWYIGMKKWGNCFEHLACIQEYNNKRANDWELNEKVCNQEFGFASLLDYKDWDLNAFQSGQIHILKKSYISEVLWNESYHWKEPEDVRLSNDLRNNGYLVRLNPYSKVRLLIYNLGYLPLVTYDNRKLSKERNGPWLRIWQRKIYQILSKWSLSRKMGLNIWKYLYKIN